MQDQKFASRFSGQEFYFRDHVVGTQKVLPGVAFLEMAKVAGELSGSEKVHVIRNVIWERPLIAGSDPEEIQISLTPVKNAVRFSVKTSGENPSVQIVTDKKTYAAGEVPKLLIAAGQPNTAVFITIEGRNVREYKILRSQDSTVSFDLPVTVQDEPGIAVSAAFVRDGVFHNGSKYVKVPPVQHQLVDLLPGNRAAQF